MASPAEVRLVPHIFGSDGIRNLFRPPQDWGMRGSRWEMLGEEEDSMMWTNRLTRVAIASLGALGVLGCGPAGGEPPEGDGNIARVQQPFETECVRIDQKSSSSRLGSEGDQVFVDFFFREPDPRRTWCLDLVASLRYQLRPYEVQEMYVDAYTSGNDYSVVLRPRQSDLTQTWSIFSDGPNVFRIQQVSSGRYLDAHTPVPGSGTGFAVTRPPQYDGSQQWYITPEGCTCHPPD